MPDPKGNSRVLHRIIYTKQKGWECGLVAISKCKTGLPSPLLGCCYFPTELKCWHSRHVARNLLSKTLQFLCIGKEHFFQWVLLCVLPDSRGNNSYIWLQICGRCRERHLQIPDPKISWNINMNIKLTLPI